MIFSKVKVGVGLAVMTVLAMILTRNCEASAGEIFTRNSTKMTYPAARTMPVKSPYIGTDIKYYSSDKTVATVSKEGEIMALAAGSCTIFARNGEGVWDTCHVTVEEPDTPHKQIALTFDDGPDYYGAELLDFLADRGVHVTFFYIGNQVKKYADNVYRAYNEGHEIGNHSYTHATLGGSASVDKIVSEITKCDEAIYEVLGTYPTVFRPPGGSKGNNLINNCNYPIILWSVDTLDWKYRDADRVYQQVHDGAADGAVILVHEIHKTTIAGIKPAIDKLLEEGWEFVTVSELWERDGYEFENGAVYGRKK